MEVNTYAMEALRECYESALGALWERSPVLWGLYSHGGSYLYLREGGVAMRLWLLSSLYSLR